MAPSLELIWEGQHQPSLDEVTTAQIGRVTLGVYGGHRGAGAHKNEDAAVIWDDPDGAWTFAAVLDAHGTSDSAQLVVQLLIDGQRQLTDALNLPVGEAFSRLERALVGLLHSEDFRTACRALQGETALLCCATKGPYLWWFSVGDCVAYLLHPELVSLGQFALNQRQFFEWVGRVNGFEGENATYTRGVRALRTGRHHVLLVTDGLLEFGDRPFESPGRLAAVVTKARGPREAVEHLLREVHAGEGRDSATVIAWSLDNAQASPLPSS
ncbi:protein phosphatase 2C domain-containing protein [Deinococcus enclensis]|uniref:Serine/threonine protein phosphatase PrpC n=1 Tax=Deinococcus enclensis TaxID=1049582 RepID=A0ABT9MER9_9DEIO|nr:protein phosphatase 2C domain-containing protein [Deinococcus enclensis]MDP9765106.1 serine/threonine protein phosphatase PrpC [Deinococcus enclensis]